MKDFDLNFLEHTLTLVVYERIKAIAEDLAGNGYDMARIAAIMFRYGWISGRSCMKEARRERLELRKSEREQREENKDEGSVSNG